MAFPYGSLKFLPGISSVRVVISKKISPKAVDRNRLRRRIRAIVREVYGGTSKGLAVYPNKKAASASFQELKVELEKALGPVV